MRRMICGLVLAGLILSATSLRAQRIRFPSGVPVGATVGPVPGVAPPGVTLQPPVTTPFDPYAVGPGFGGVIQAPLPPPALTTPSFGAPAPPPTGSVVQPPYIQSQPPAVLGVPPVANPNVAPALQGPAYPSTAPGTMFPDGIAPGWNPNVGGWYSGWNAIKAPPYQRLFEDFYGRYTWIFGSPGPNDQDELKIQEVELATSLLLPGPMGLSQELRITPGFIFDALEGPNTMGAPPLPLSLPSNLYGAYIDGYVLAQFTQQIGGELNVRTGVYSDFDTVTHESVRITGRGLILLRLTPTMTLKGGVSYVDRNDIKLIPAGGVLWEPTPQTRFDIYFPRPKLAKYFSTVGANEVWWYVGAEYGGGAWTVEENPTGVTPPDYKGRIDINDVRVFAGLDFTRPSDLTGFVEGGYVFEREIFYVDVPGGATFELNETFMVRAGLIW